MDSQNGYTNHGYPWNGKTSLEIRIPELRRIQNLVFIETACLGSALVVFVLSIIVFFLSFGYARSDLGSILFAGTFLFVLLLVVFVVDTKIQKLVKIADEVFIKTITSQLNIKPVDGLSIARKKQGYVHLYSGNEIGMWEIFYYEDDASLVTFEKFNPNQYDRYIENGTIKVSGQDPEKAA